ncbi:MAG: hypothetical protein QOH61_687 [Chloroflexota bacterium]|nr:hypothetical protein [Chloroflexota bacterium]
MRGPGAWSRLGPPQEPEGGSSGRLAPARIGQLIEIGTRIVRRRWKALVGTWFLLGGVAVLLEEAAGAHFGDVLAGMMTFAPDGRASLSTTDADLQRVASAFALAAATTVLTGLCFTVASLVAATYVEADYRGSPITFGSALRSALRRAPTAVAMWLLSTLAAAAILVGCVLLSAAAVAIFPPSPGGTGGLGVLLALVVIVGGFVALVGIGIRLAVAPAVVAIEPVGAVESLRRSWHLTGHNAWRTLGLMLLVGLVVAVLGALVSELLTLLLVDPFLAEPAALHTTAAVVLGAVVNLSFAPILPVMLTVLYFDLRVRRDRLELSVAPET